MRRYVCHARVSVLRGRTVYRCPLWPWSNDQAPSPWAGRLRTGPSNVLVLDGDGRAYCVPRRTLRRVRP